MNSHTVVLATALCTFLGFPELFEAVVISSRPIIARVEDDSNNNDTSSSVCGCSVTLRSSALPNCKQSQAHQFMDLLEHFLRHQCDIEDPCGQITPPSTILDEYDFIVVGGGSAGSVVASRLSEVSEVKVLLVEAGLNEPAGSQVPSYYGNYANTSIDWQYYTEPEQEACLGYFEQRCYWPRGKVIGGTSVLNGMMYTRGNKNDYNNWEALGNSGWSYESILPYFLKSEDNLQIDELNKTYHSTGGLLPVSRFPYQPPMVNDILAAAQEMGYRVGDLTGEIQGGFSIAQMNSRNGVRFSMSRAFLRPAQNRTNLHVLLNTTVTRVLVTSENGTTSAGGVEIITKNGTMLNIKAKKEVIISGGAVNSPQILLLSGIGNQTELEKVGVPVVLNLPGVGKNLHNHVSYTLDFHINSTGTEDLNWASAMDYLLYRNGPLSSTAITQATGFVQTKYANAGEDDPDIQMFFMGYQASCSDTGVVGELSDNGTSRVVSISPTLIHTKSRGYLTLRDNNPFSHPKIYANYLTNKSDVDTLIEGIKITIKFTEMNALAKYNFSLVTTPVEGCESLTFGSDEYWECAIRRRNNGENHQAGSCKMGPSSDPLAVVDERLRVHGVQGLRVVDSSIMPKVTSGNINGPIIMIAEKASDMIKQDWSIPSSALSAILKSNSIFLCLFSLCLLRYIY